MSEAKYPGIEVQLTGTDGNAIALLSKVSRALRRNGHASEVDDFMAEATSGDYDHLLATCVKWVRVS